MTREEHDSLKLFEMTINEEHFFIEAHQTRIAFYSGFVTALVVGIIVGLMQASEWYHFAALCIGPVVLFIVSANAIAGTSSLYRRFLEAVTVRAKIEQQLGLTGELSGDAGSDDFYWESEPLIPRRYIESCKAYESSDAFVKELAAKGYQGVTKRLFRWFQWLSLLMLIGLVTLTVWKAL